MPNEPPKIAKALFNEDLPNGDIMITCDNCGHTKVNKHQKPFGVCPQCKCDLIYPPGASW